VKAGKLKPGDYVHLHNHTHYSLLDGLTKLPELVDFTKQTGMVAIAQTDHGTLSGAIDFYKTCMSRDIKPIIGIETYIASRKISDREPGKDKINYHLILLAMNNTGYQNLMRLSTIANLEGMYYKPRIDHDLLAKYNEGLICLSGCISGELGDHLRQGQYDEAKAIAAWYKKIFGDRYYLELQDHGHPDHPTKWAEQETVNQQLLKLSDELDIRPVVTCDAHYLRREDQAAHEILLCVQTGSFLSDEKRMTLANLELHVTDPKEIIARWSKDHPEVITNTRVIADRCHVTIELGKILIPKFPVPRGEDEKSYLHKLVWRGLAWRYGRVSAEKSAELSIPAARQTLKPEIIQRTEYELEIMDTMGFNGYFLIVQDFITWGKDQGIIFGPGRGSAAGSIVAYAIRITEIEPLAYKLMFERFLNPGRITMPDIDIDIQDTRRDEVINYCVEKYGSDRVANIVTFGTMAARNAVRDVSRVLQVPYAEADRLAKMIPPLIQGRHIPLKQSIKEDVSLRSEYANNDTAKQVFDLAVQLEGTIRSHGVHAAGVVIAPDDIVKFVPLEMAQKGVVATQYPMGPIEELGLLKMDFLGLSNLTVINNALRIIRKVYKNSIDLSRVPNDDPKTFELLQHADTTGVFQLESAGMKRYLKELKPTLFDDIIAMGALYRPGPMSEVPRFIQGKNNPASITYLHQSLEPILRDTYGVMVYQEQIIQLLQLVAGYTPGEADLVRKAIGKKKRDIMKAEEPKFIDGCIKQGLTRADAQKLWAQIQPFADYSFNKAHATCYAQISYWTAYLKANYPSAFMAALMTSDYDDTDRLAIEIAECQHIGIDVLPPDVNESFHEFAVVPDGDNRKPQIRFGMDAIKNVGSGAVEEILRARKLNGSFETLEAYLENVDSRIVNHKALESLIKAGAFDRYAERSQLLHNLDAILSYASRLQKEVNSGQTGLFSDLGGAVRSQLTLEKPTTVYDPHEQLQWERELLGIYLSQHPLSLYETFLEEQTMPLSNLKPEHDGRSVVIGGAITTIREITTKNGARMAFIGIEDKSAISELILFPNVYQQTVGLWEQDRIVLVRGKVSAKGRDGSLANEVKIVVDDGREITAEQAMTYMPTGEKMRLSDWQTSTKSSMARSDVASVGISGEGLQFTDDTAMSSTVLPKSPPTRVYIRLQDSQNQDLLLSLKRCMDKTPGSTEVVLVLGQAGAKQIIKLPGGVEQLPGVLGELEQLAGANNVKVA
jgi:DNA polymerase-3 subunit alpha